MISNTTVTDKGAKSVVSKITAPEKKNKVTVALGTKANGDKLISSFQDINAKFEI